MSDAGQSSMFFRLDAATELPVRVRVSSRASRQSIRFEHTGELEVVVPERGSREGGLSLKQAIQPDAVQRFLEQHRSWIARTYKKVAPQAQAYQQSAAAGRPGIVEFKAIGEVWQVRYQSTAAKSIRATASEGFIQLSGNLGNTGLLHKALRKTVLGIAKAKLPAFAAEVVDTAAPVLGQRPVSIQVADRKRTWGTCDAKGHVKLDCKLLFFPPALARQVVLHELAHLRHLNHSSAFYDLLFTLPGSIREQEKAAHV